MDNAGRDRRRDPVELRRQAEEKVRRRLPTLDPAAAAEVNALVHELEVHRVELEMQNEELLRTQRELEVSRDAYADLYDFAPVGYVTFDRRGRVMGINLTGTGLLGRERQWIVGQSFLLCVESHDHGRFLAHVAECIDNEREGVCEVTLWRSNRSKFVARLRSAPFSTAEGEIACRAILIDITEERETADRLRKAKEAAEAAAVAKGQFLANMSHELRTPMAAILGELEMALDEEVPAQIRDGLVTAKESADVLLRLLNELLDFSRIESGKFEIETLPFRLRQTIDDVYKTLRGRAKDKGLELTCSVDGDVPDRVIGDVLRLRQVLVNLVGNAIKFTETGRVDLHVAPFSANAFSPNACVGSTAPLLRFSVTDTGIGVAPEDRERIFHAFTQADSSTHRLFGGTGLGLTISASLVGLMGGQIKVESEPGRGSTFWFAIPMPLQPPEAEGAVQEAAPVAVPSQEPLPPPVVHLRILLAEDTPANQKMLVRILQKRGHEVEVAATGHEALARIAAAEFDLVLMDVQMPQMDGFEATAAIRALPGAKARLPIIAMTAHALPADRQRCLAAGMDAYLSKPIDSRSLIETIESLAKPR